MGELVFEHVYTVKTQGSKKDFLRKLLLRIGNDKDSPLDISKVTFGEVKESTIEVLDAHFYFEMDCNVSIGYRHGNFIDWQPYSQHVSTPGYASCINGEEVETSSISKDRLTYALLHLNDDELIEEGAAEVSQKALISAKLASIDSAIDNAALYFPGDVSRDHNYSNLDSTTTTLKCYRLPYYEVQIFYEGKSYVASVFPCGRYEISCQLPKVSSYGGITTENIRPLEKQEKTKYCIKLAISYIPFLALFIMACALNSAGTHWTWVFPLLAFGGAIVAHIIFNKRFNETIQGIPPKMTEYKRKELDQCLSKNSLSLLSTTESDSFKKYNEFKTDGYYSEIKLKLPVILCAIAMVILIIVSCATWGVSSSKAKYAEEHDPTQFKISVVSKTEEWEDDDRYYNGCYYVNFTYKVESQDLGCEYMQIKTTVYDKNGKELGYIKSELDTMNLTKNSNKTYTTYLRSIKPENDSFFQTLYNTDFKDLTFKSEAYRIEFSDGELWTSDNYIY